jgi:hypothetical protein
VLSNDAADMEQQVLNASGLDAVVLRYGPGTWRETSGNKPGLTSMLRHTQRGSRSHTARRASTISRTTTAWSPSPRRVRNLALIREFDCSESRLI